MSEGINIRTAYCQECGENFEMGYSDEDEEMYIVCDCGVSEEVGDFIERFMEAHNNTYEKQDDVRGFQ